MATVSEVQEAKNWIHDKLAANVDIASIVSTRIYSDTYEGQRTFPYILVNLMAATDIQGNGHFRQSTNALFQVRVVIQGRPSANAKLVDQRINDVLQFTADDLSGDYYFSANREGVVDRPEYGADGARYHNLGGLYRVWIRKTP